MVGCQELPVLHMPLHNRSQRRRKNVKLCATESHNEKQKKCMNRKNLFERPKRWEKKKNHKYKQEGILGLEELVECMLCGENGGILL